MRTKNSFSWPFSNVNNTEIGGVFAVNESSQQVWIEGSATVH